MKLGVLATVLWSLQGHPVLMERVTTDPPAWVHCPGEKSPERCQALQGLGRATLSGIPASRLRGGKNPGSLICRDVLAGQVVLGTDARNQEQSFCQFPDGSQVSTGSLVSRARYAGG